MKKSIVVGGIALGVIVAGFLYFGRESTPESASPNSAAREQRDGATPAVPGAQQAEDASGASSRRSDGRPLAPDPRLATLAVSPPNDLIEFVVDDNGKVIAELDKDPASISFKKPLREYMYAGDRVIGLTAYRYLPDQVEVSRTRVAYKPDGSIADFAQATTYNDTKNQR